MNILAIDYGLARIGLAWAQAGLDVVLPFGVIDARQKYFLLELKKIIEQEKIALVVVGMPYGLDGKENENTLRVKNFISDLESNFGLEIKTIDERFSSLAADKIGSTGASRDEKAAMIILQMFIDNKN